MNRRSFFSAFARSGAVTAAGVALSTDAVAASPERAVEFLNPMCPSCAALFDVTRLIPLQRDESYGWRATRGCTPIAVTCHCGWEGQITFYRRQ